MRIRLTLLMNLATVGLLAVTCAGALGSPNSTTSLSDPVTMMSLLSERGLLGGTLNNSGSPKMPVPPAGVEVDDYVQRAADTGEEIQKTSNWDENLGDGSLHVEIARSASGVSRASYWVRRHHGAGCILFGMNEYDRDGRLLKSKIWRNDKDEKPFRGPDYPSTLFPNAAEGGMPFDALWLALSSPSQGATGVAYTSITPYQIVALDVWVADVESVRVPAGEFQAMKVIMRTDARSVGIPAFIAGLVQPFLPKNIFYCEAQTPHRLLKFEGVMDQNAPRVTIDLVRYYVAGKNGSPMAGVHPTNPSPDPAR